MIKANSQNNKIIGDGALHSMNSKQHGPKIYSFDAENTGMNISSAVKFFILNWASAEDNFTYLRALYKDKNIHWIVVNHDKTLYRRRTAGRINGLFQYRQMCTEEEQAGEGQSMEAKHFLPDQPPFIQIISNNTGTGKSTTLNHLAEKRKTN